ncbi:iron-containing alcohol dehydrogenase [Aneurinibacillus sp. BA2021]|nr:iron-containing alcohol dehydrogenase [Aneurinibacillus sp. BA2021]
MTIHQFLAPEVIVTGAGSLQKTGEYAARYGSKALIVTDKVLASLGITKPLEKVLAQAGIESTVFSDVSGEPTLSEVMEGLALCRKSGCEMLLAIGGGSAIDTAKAISMMDRNEAPMSQYMGMEKVQQPGLPLIAIPTTAGTGSEVTRVTVITDKETDVKMMIASRFLVPRVAILDPELTVSCPKGVTAGTGVDALTHAIEAYISRKQQPLTDTMALSAIRRIYPHLERAWLDGNDMEAREQVLIGAMEAGLAFSNASVALVHGMSRPIGALFHVPHGISNAILLPSVMRFSAPQAVERFADIARAMGADTEGMTAAEAADLAVRMVEELCESLQLPSLQELGVDPEKFMDAAPKMARDALASGSPDQNPRLASDEEIIELYKELVEKSYMTKGA